MSSAMGKIPMEYLKFPECDKKVDFFQIFAYSPNLCRFEVYGQLKGGLSQLISLFDKDFGSLNVFFTVVHFSWRIFRLMTKCRCFNVGLSFTFWTTLTTQ